MIQSETHFGRDDKYFASSDFMAKLVIDMEGILHFLQYKGILPSFPLTAMIQKEEFYFVQNIDVSAALER